jgi:hypothetical protein
MRSRLPKTLFILVLASVALAAQDPVSLKRDLKPGKDSYTVKTVVKQVVQLPNGMGEQEMTINTSMDQSIEIKSVDAEGYAEVESIASNVKTEMDGPMAGMMGQAPTGDIKTTYKQDAFGRVKDMKVQGAPGGMGALMDPSSLVQMNALFVPEKPVAVGEEWKVELPKNPVFGNTPQTLTARFLGEREWEGQKVWVVSTSGPIQLEMDLSQMMSGSDNPMAGMKIIMRGTIDVKSEVFLEKGTGRTLYTVSNATNKMRMEIPDMGMSLDINGTTQSTSTIKK